MVQGGTGSGKTKFMTSVVSRALRERTPVGVIDCKSGFYDAALEWAGSVAYGLAEPARSDFIRSLVVVDPFGETLVPLNICRVMQGTSPEVQAYNVCQAFARLFDAAFGFQMGNILLNLVLLLMEAELSLVEAPEVLQNQLLRGILVDRSQHQQVKDYFTRTYPTVPAGSKDALLARLQSLLLPENLRLMLGADELINFKEILDRGDPLFMFLGKGAGVPEEQVEVIGSLLLQLLFQGAFASDNNRRRPYQIVCDEFFHLLDAPGLDKRFETALTTLRSFRVHLSLVMQNFSQISGTLRDTILGNCDVMAIFRTSSRNAQYFGDFLPELDPEIVEKALQKTGKPPHRMEVRSQLTERMQRLPNRHCYFYDRRRPYRALLLRVPDMPEPHEPIHISPEQLSEFITAQGIRQGRAGLSKAVLRGQIEARRARLQALLQPAEIRIPETPKPEGENRMRQGPRLG
ncbi:MAG TPA: TraM recognition domain-containing protein [Myxococcaceae bacterium]|nr:TraM recognition domain-containing protein [Myxococcaceae bacterium]